MPGSDKKCCVPGCLESGRSHHVLHGFPNPLKEHDRFSLWLKTVGGDILNLPADHIYKYRRVCHSHFELKYCCRYNRISNIAYPTLNMPAILDVENLTLPIRRPMSQIQNVLAMPSTSRVSEAFVVPLGQDKENEKSPNSMMPVAHVNVYSESSLQKGVPKVGKALLPRKSLIATETEKKLYKKLRETRMKLSKCKSLAKKRSVALKEAKKVISKPDFLKILENLPKTAKIITKMQLKNVKKHGKGRRFSLDDKILGLSIFKQSPKGYRHLRKLLILPAPQTLIKVINQANICPGINKNVFKQLKKTVEKIKIEHRLCILLFDEVSLRANISYNARKDEVVGFVTDGLHIKPDYADHAQVFMIRGLVKNYKQPVAYTFSCSATKGPELKKQIKTLISELQKTGLIVVATVCDQGTNNRQAIKLLLQEARAEFLINGQNPNDNVFIVNGEEITPLYDPPHLLKCIRNNLLTKDLRYTIDNVNGTAKWAHLELLLKENPGYKGMRLIPKLTEYHIVANKIPKMKVKYASQVFSQSVANTMGYLSDKGILPIECKETADLILFFDTLFDSVNGSFNKKHKYCKPLGPVTPHSKHHNIWEKSKVILKNMKFIDRRTGRLESIPSLNNWVFTLNSIKVLLESMKKKYCISSIWMRHLNQDPLENFFGAIRSHGCRNNNPSPENFESAYTSLLINNYSSSYCVGGNCQKDTCKILNTFIVTNDDCTATKTCDLQNYPDIHFSNIEEKQKDPRKIGPLQYVSGYFVEKSKINIFKNCNQCSADLIAIEECEFIKYKEFAGKHWLCSPTHKMIHCVSQLQDIYISLLKSYLHVRNIKCMIKTIIFTMVSFDFIQCEKHKDTLIDFLINLASRFFIHNYCKNINKIMIGLRQCDDENDIYQLKAKKHHSKCFKRKK